LSPKKGGTETLPIVSLQSRHLRVKWNFSLV
jgi:hypothetical protein